MLTDETPSFTEWKATCERAEKAVDDALKELVSDLMDRDRPGMLAAAVAHGAFLAALSFMRLCQGDNYDVKKEQMALATVRGVFRDEESPIGEDGKPFKFPFDA
jgi:hypothetical protein